MINISYTCEIPVAVETATVLKLDRHRKIAERKCRSAIPPSAARIKPHGSADRSLLPRAVGSDFGLTLRILQRPEFSCHAAGNGSRLTGVLEAGEIRPVAP
jgi:hypothetical protein